MDYQMNQNQQKKKRRPRSAAGERNYLCGCGKVKPLHNPIVLHLWNISFYNKYNPKAYLSYPALYTHVKNKHNGIFPIGSNAKRKIPRNMEENDDSFIIDVKRLMDEFEKFIASLPDAVQSSKVENMSSKSDGYIESLIDPSFPDYDKDIKPLLDSLKWAKSFVVSSTELNISMDDLTIYQVFAIFLASIYKVNPNKFCSNSFFKEYTILFAMLVKALNDKGEMFLDKEEKVMESINTQNNLFCESTKVHISAEILNLFIAELFPKYLRELEK